MKLEIRKISDMFWKTYKGIVQIKGFAFYSPEKNGYMIFKHDYYFEDEVPYVPCGGKKTLEKIIADGGLTHYNDVIWINPVKVGDSANV